MLENSPTIEEMENIRATSQNVQIASRFNFLKNHNGLRLGHLHGLMGTTGSGKSSLAKSIISEIAFKEKVTVFLSEETKEQYCLALAKNNITQPILDRITWVEEKKIDSRFFESRAIFWEYIEMLLLDSESRAIIIDNVSTSYIYNGSLNEQRDAAKNLLKLARKYNKAILYLIHSNKQTKDNPKEAISNEDNRGFAGIVIESEFFYIMHRFTQDGNERRLLKVAKFRGYDKARGWYGLYYENYLYTGDMKADSEMVKDYFENKDKY